MTNYGYGLYLTPTHTVMTEDLSFRKAKDEEDNRKCSHDRERLYVTLYERLMQEAEEQEKERTRQSESPCLELYEKAA